jgi:hypothetical protein
MPIENLLVGEAIAGQAAQTRKRLEDLVTNTNRAAFDIGELAYQVKRNGDYAGHTTFADYAKTLDIKLQRLRYLSRIAEVFEAVGIPRNRYECLGLAKCRAITSLNPDDIWVNPQTSEQTPVRDFITEFAEQGSDLTLEKIQEHVRVLKGLTGENDITWLNLPFLRSVIDNVINPTVELTRCNIGSVSKDDEGISQDASVSKCIEVWAVEYRNDPANSSRVPTLGASARIHQSAQGLFWGQPQNHGCVSGVENSGVAVMDTEPEG